MRIDTVHQGDLDGIKGVYHITCVDAVSQWQVQACVQGIGEAHLLPVLGLIIDQFPFVVRGFHSDNGSEYKALSLLWRDRDLVCSIRSFSSILATRHNMRVDALRHIEA